MRVNKKQSIPRAEIGVLGGSGFYDLVDSPREVEVETAFGLPSDKVRVGTINGRRVAFIARHGQGHKLAPHKIPYRANLMAFKMMGVKRVISPAAVGSLNPLVRPGDFVIVDQFVNWSWGRDDTYYSGEKVEGIKKSDRVAHMAMADPYCKELRKVAGRSCVKLDISHHLSGTIVVIGGPRFSTRAESKFFGSQGFDIINMTAYPEVALARELGMCYVNIGLVTDFDVGVGNIKPVSIGEVFRVFKENNEKVKELIYLIVGGISSARKCGCERHAARAIV